MANTNPTNSMRFRAKIVMTAVFVVLFGGVAANFFRISVLNNKKYQAMACLCSDTAIANEFNGYAQKHQQHFDTLAAFLK